MKPLRPIWLDVDGYRQIRAENGARKATSASAPELTGERREYLRSSSLPLHRPGIGPQRCALWVRADADATELSHGLLVLEENSFV